MTEGFPYALPPADMFFRGCGFLLSIFAATACAQALPSGARPVAPTSVLTSYRAMPVRLCVPVKADDWTALRSGGTRLILHLQNQVPSYAYSPTFQVSLIGPAESQRVPVDHLAMQPDNTPPAGGLPGPQHFAIDLREHLSTSAARSKLCVEVGVEAGDHDATPEEGKAGHPLRIWATLEPLGAHP